MVLTVGRGTLLPNHLIEGVLFHAGNKKDALGGPFTEYLKIVVAPVIDDNGARIKFQMVGDFHIRYPSLGDQGKGGQVAVMV